MKFTHVLNGAPVQASQAFSMNLTQTGANVGGVWQATGGDVPNVPKNGNVGGVASTTAFSGTFTFLASDLTTGTSCNGSLQVSGPAGGNTMTWTSPNVTGNCTDPPTNITLTATRQ